MATDLQQSPAKNFSLLREEGIALLQRLAGDTWTDHNAHDPGITILEQLCYALSDLSYRAQYELPDLLTREGEDPYASLYTPAQIFPTSPVTITDLRKLVIDVPGVKNAWIDIVEEPSAILDAARAKVSYLIPQEARLGAPAPSPNVSEIRVKGLYRVGIEKSDLVDIDGSVIRREAVRRLHRFRGLGQDFQAIEVLYQQDVRLGATLEIDAVEDASALLARAYQSIADYLSPSVPFHTLEEMLERNHYVDEIFEGPLLEHGFIDSEELAQIERRTSVRTSDLIRELMSIPGVAAVKNICFLVAASDGKGFVPTNDWLLNIDADKTPCFDRENSRIVLERGGLPVDQGIGIGAQELYEKRAKKAASPVAISPAERDLRPLQGRDRNVANYYSVQQQFPMVYGIGSTGLSQSAPPEREAQAKQLKAYLMFYDQLLANYFAQLANVSRLFSFDDASPESYFSQALLDEDAPGLDAIRVSDLHEHRKLLQRITEEPEADGSGNESSTRRRNRFLDHLLARFGQQFHELAMLRPTANANSEATARQRLADHKRAFLRDYPRIGRARGAAFNCLEPVSEDNVSGLELSLRHKLGISGPEERFHVIEHVLLRPTPGDTNQRGPLFRDAQFRDPYSLQISFVFPAWGRYDNNFRNFVKQTVREETPAHLTAHFVWMKDEMAMQEFETAYKAWLERLRSYRLAELGL